LILSALLVLAGAVLGGIAGWWIVGVFQDWLEVDL
jgi:membrane protein YqaA with SNARE-associated domain